MQDQDKRFLELAQLVAGWSKDPRTKCGSVVVRPDGTVASLGFNGFPRGVADSDERLNDRACKHALMIHAEENALLHAREPFAGYAIYVWPIQPCSRCAAKIIQAGIARVVCPKELRTTDEFMDMELGQSVFKECGVEFTTA